MTERLLIATDLDRTLMPNGPEPESPGARRRFAHVATRPQVTLAYVSGRHRSLVEQAIADYELPVPDFVIGDVGTSIYQVGARSEWDHSTGWEQRIAADWGGHGPETLAARLREFTDLRLQEAHKQNRFKLSYYVPIDLRPQRLEGPILERLSAAGVRARLVWSIDEPAGMGLLDILPVSASKLHALEALMAAQGFGYADTVFCGDSGNDLEVLASAVPAVLVANSQPAVQASARELAVAGGNADRLHIARGGFMGMNGNYSGGMLEGIVHFHPDVAGWLAEGQ